MTTIHCPHCGLEVEISQALELQVAERIEKELSEKHKKELLDVQVQAEIASTKKIEEQFAVKIKQAIEDADAAILRNKKLLEQVTELTKSMRQLKTEKDEVKLEMEKRLAAEEEKIRADAQKKAEEEQHLKLIEKDKQLENALKEVDDMRRKLQQGSQQMQGEAFELEFEDLLTHEFPNDVIAEVAKGTRGGDITHEVWDRNGNHCGTLLWELKNTKVWSEQWVEKLKEDQRGAKAEYAIIISEAVPSDVTTAKFYKNIWVTKRHFAVGLAYALRLTVIQLFTAKKGNEGVKEKKDIMYTYLLSTEFRLRVEAIVEAFSNMQIEVEKERRYFTAKWARDEKNIRQVIDNTVGMYGDVKGIIGNALPQIKALELDNDQLLLPHEKPDTTI